MKVLFINTLLHGGASKGAQYLFNLITEDIKDSKFLYLKGTDTKDKKFVRYSKYFYFDKILSKFLSKIIKNRIISPYSLRNFKKKYRQSSDLTIVSHCRTINTGIKIYNSNIIHLNWVADFIDYPDFFSRIQNNNKIVWTLRDMNAFTGGCHYSCDYEGKWCKQFYEGCVDCPMLSVGDNGPMIEEIFSIKYKSVSKIKDEDMKIVCPSLWVMEESKKSKLFSRFEHIYISHGVNTNIYTLMNKDETRKNLGLGIDKKIILFISDIVDDKRKGLKLLVDAIKKLEVKELFLITVGKKEGEIEIPDHIEMVHYGFISSDEKMAELYNCADVFVTPSLAESFGFTVAESLCCGTPVIAFKTTAITEKINEGENGYLAEFNNSISLCEKIEYFIKNGVNKTKQSISEEAMILYSHNKMKQNYIKLYNDLINPIRK